MPFWASATSRRATRNASFESARAAVKYSAAYRRSLLKFCKQVCLVIFVSVHFVFPCNRPEASRFFDVGCLGRFVSAKKKNYVRSGDAVIDPVAGTKINPAFGSPAANGKRIAKITPAHARDTGSHRELQGPVRDAISPDAKRRRRAVRRHVVEYLPFPCFHFFAAWRPCPIVAYKLHTNKARQAPLECMSHRSFVPRIARQSSSVSSAVGEESAFQRQVRPFRAVYTLFP